jgi:hypothetical protein
MSEEEKKQLEEKLNFLYNESVSEGNDLDNPQGLIANPEIFGINLEDNQMDYQEEMKKSFTESKNVLENMATMYLENETLLKNSYIRNKILNDAQNLSDMAFLQKISKRVIIKQLEQIEMGEATPRHYETLAMMMRENRENIRQSTVTVSTMEDFYRKIRNDMGMENQILPEGTENKSEITTTNDLNSKLEEIIRNRNRD